MKLSDQVLLGLRRLGNQTLISEDCFKNIIQSAAAVLSDSSGSQNTGKVSLFRITNQKLFYTILLIVHIN